MGRLRILMVEGSGGGLDPVLAEAERQGVSIERTHRVLTPAALETALRAGSWDLALVEYRSAGFPGLEALRLARAARPDLPLIFISDVPGEAAAVAAIKAGADEYLMRTGSARLGETIERELRARDSRRAAEEAARQGEDRLRLAQRMETVARLAGGVAHDFNNILSVVSGYANLLQMKLSREGDAPRELMEIDKAVLKASALVRQLLTFSRKQMVQPQVLDLAQVVADLVPTLRLVVGEDIAVETRLEPMPWRIRGDKPQIELILMNLAVNAKEAMPRGGVLAIEVSSEVLSLEDFRQGERAVPGTYLRLTVRDTGEGIPPEIMPRIFEPFFTTKGERRGTGLGLSTVYGIVLQMQGLLRVDSAPGRGAVFSLFLPCLSTAAGTGGERNGSVPCSSKGETVLLVEDDVDLRKLTKDILGLDGYTVLEAATPEEALGYSRSAARIDLLLTDLALPRMHGKALADAALAIRPGLRVVYMSGYAPGSMHPDVGLLPEFHFLEKPFTPARLLAKLRSALDAPQPEKHL
jgi:signal transduction histidine kinase